MRRRSPASSRTRTSARSSSSAASTARTSSRWSTSGARICSRSRTGCASSSSRCRSRWRASSIAKVLEGLDYAHRKRDPLGRPLEIVHRDCSPQNVLVSYEGEVKVIDFGIAKATSRNSRTMAGVLKGKFGYMSPGAGARPAARSPQRHLRARHDALRVPDRRAPVPGRDRLLDAREGAQRRHPTAARGQPGDPRARRARDPEGAREGRRRSLPVVQRDARRPPAVPDEPGRRVHGEVAVELAQGSRSRRRSIASASSSSSTSASAATA